MLAEELRYALGLVCREIVSDHMNPLALRLMRDDVTEESHKFGRGVSGRGFAQYLTRLGIESRVQRQGAVTKVLKSVPLDSPWRQRQHRIKAIKGLNRSLFVDTEHRPMCRRIQIQPNDVSRFGFKLRVIRGHVAFHSLRLEPMLGPYPSHCHVMRTQFLGQFACAPMRGS